MRLLIAIVSTGLMILGARTPLAEDTPEALGRLLAERLPGVGVEHIKPSPIPGLYQVSFAGGVLYVSEDGRYVVSGRIIEWATGRDLTEAVLGERRLALLAGMPESKMIRFEAAGEAKHTLTTFTDVDCPYCRRMHAEMPALNRSGVRVRYLLFPRTGVGSPSYKKAVSVWCAEDRHAEMTLAKRGETPTPRDCEHPVDEHMRLAEALGITGTPMTITDTGERIMGYVPAPELLRRLEAAKGGEE